MNKPSTCLKQGFFTCKKSKDAKPTQKGEEKGLPQGEGKRVEGKDRRVRGRRPGGSTATAVVAKVRGTGEEA